MTKFLKFSVSGNEQLVPCNDIQWLNKTNNTTTTVVYKTAKSLVLTHGAVTDESFLRALEANVQKCLSNPWNIVSTNVENLPASVTGIAVG